MASNEKRCLTKMQSFSEIWLCLLIIQQNCFWFKCQFAWTALHESQQNIYFLKYWYICDIVTSKIVVVYDYFECHKQVIQLLNNKFHVLYARHYNPLLIRNLSWILTIHKARIFRKKPLEKTFLDFKKWVKSIQTNGYNGRRTVVIPKAFTIRIPQ